MRKLLWYALGFAMLLFSGMTWAWMLGAFAPKTVNGLSANAVKWLNPGILSMPATISIFIGLIGILFLIGVFPLELDKGKENEKQPSVLG